MSKEGKVPAEEKVRIVEGYLTNHKIRDTTPNSDTLNVMEKYDSIFISRCSINEWHIF
jgi:hypothetical protein